MSCKWPGGVDVLQLLSDVRGEERVVGGIAATRGQGSLRREGAALR